jgi:hypothetical protein
MQQAIKAYRSITVTPEFREMERLRSKARHDEAQALYHAEKVGEERANAKWQGVVANKDTALAEQAALIKNLLAQLEQNK